MLKSMQLFGIHSLALISVSAGISAGAHAQTPDYNLVSYGNDSFRTFSYAELKSEVGADASLLPNYICDGKREYEILPEPLRSNPKGDSLRIHAKDQNSSEYFIYRNKKLYKANGHRKFFTFNLDEFERSIFQTLKKLESYPTGHLLLERMEHAYYPIVIVSGQDRFLPMEIGGKKGFGIYRSSILQAFASNYETTEAAEYLNQIGSGGELSFDPIDLHQHYKRVESDGVIRHADPYIVIAHEAFHALDSIAGNLDFRYVDGPTYESQPVSEYRAVYFENIIRQESGRLMAKYYNPNPDETIAINAPGILNAKGEQRLIPAPCITSASAIQN